MIAIIHFKLIAINKHENNKQLYKDTCMYRYFITMETYKSDVFIDYKSAQQLN